MIEEMEGELINFIKVWLSVLISLCYCYATGKIVPKGTTRFVSLFPVVCIFLYLPLNLHTLHLGGTTAFIIAWLTNFKLLLFAFGKGPLAFDPSISFGRFLALACLPIKFRQDPPPQRHFNKPLVATIGIDSKSPKSNPNNQIEEKTLGGEAPLFFMIKVGIMTALFIVYEYIDRIPQKVMWALLCIHIYISLELVLAILATIARSLLEIGLEPQFNKPYLCTSLQDFWGKRWNLMVTGILRPSVFEPVVKLATRLVGRKWAQLPAVMGTFVVSGLMHELIFYYMGRVMPTWEITFYFVVNGIFLVMEIVLKKKLGNRWRLPPVVSRPLTIGFFLVTSFWWFFPPFVKNCKVDVRVVEEFSELRSFVKKLFLRNFANCDFRK